MLRFAQSVLIVRAVVIFSIMGIYAMTIGNSIHVYCRLDRGEVLNEELVFERMHSHVSEEKFFSVTLCRHGYLIYWP